MITAAGPPIDEAILVHVQTCVLAPETTPPHTLHKAVNAFADAFDQWNPNHILQIKPSDKSVLDVLFTTSNIGDFIFYHNLYQCRSQIHSIVSSWTQKLNAWVLTNDEITQVVCQLQAGTWDSYRDSCKKDPKLLDNYAKSLEKAESNLLLPTIEILQRRIYELCHPDEVIAEYLTLQIHGRTYHLSEIIGKCKGGYYRYNHIFGDRYPRQLQELQEKFGPKPDFIYILAYFDLYPSIICPDILPYRDPCNRHDDDPPFADIVNKNLRPITEAFGSGMTYNGVMNALQVLGTDERLDIEIETLSNCERLEITAWDVTNFRVVKLLQDISTPLQDLIKVCEQYKFNVVDYDDGSFKALQDKVSKFYSSTTSDREVCLSFFDYLYHVLFDPRHDNESSNTANDPSVATSSYLTLLHKIHEMSKVIPVLVHIPYVLHGPKLWQFCREMGWFTGTAEENEGSALQFDMDYNTVSTTLSKFGALKEAIIVKSLQPVVRFFTSVQKLSACQSLHCLISSAQNDKRIVAETSTIVTDIHKLNGRIVPMKDLFHNLCPSPWIATQPVSTMPLSALSQTKMTTSSPFTPRATNQPPALVSMIPQETPVLALSPTTEPTKQLAANAQILSVPTNQLDDAAEHPPTPVPSGQDQDSPLTNHVSPIVETISANTTLEEAFVSTEIVHQESHYTGSTTPAISQQPPSSPIAATQPIVTTTTNISQLNIGGLTLTLGSAGVPTLSSVSVFQFNGSSPTTQPHQPATTTQQAVEYSLSEPSIQPISTATPNTTKPS